jgi:hypothetical protein
MASLGQLIINIKRVFFLLKLRINILLTKINNKHKQHITQQYHILNFSYNTTMQLRLPNDLFFIKCLKKYLLKELNIIMLY